MEQALAAPASYLFHSPWASFFLKDSELLSQEGYLTSENDRFLFVLVRNRPADRSFVKHAIPLQALRDHVKILQRDFPDVQAGVTGSMALGSDEMGSSQRDTALATVLSLLSVGVLYIAIFWEVWSPLRVQIALQLAICWSLGWATLTVGHLNILSVTFAPSSLVWRIIWAFTWRRAIAKNELPAMIFVPRWRSPHGRRVQAL